MFRQYLTGIAFILLAVPSSSQQTSSRNVSLTTQISYLVAQAAQTYNPLSSAYLTLTKVPELLSDEQVFVLRRIGYAVFAFEWSLRLFKHDNSEQAWLLFEQYWNKTPKASHIRLLALLQEKKRFHAMERVQSRVGNIEPYASISAMGLGRSVDVLNKASVAQLGLKVLDEHTQVNNCDHAILLLAETLSGLEQLELLKEQYVQNALSDVLPYCLSEPLYIGDITQCNSHASAFIQCDIKPLVQKSTILRARHLVIMTEEQGLANVHNGVMRLHHKSEFELFIHELMHFAYFEDEYPVPSSKADWLCKTEGFKAPNLYVGKTAPSGWYQSDTCKFGLLQSYKPQHIASKMQYHEIHLSNHYLGLWLKSLNKTLSVPSDYQVYLNELNTKH
ncbi:hypothetical protein [Pseudoalteromonas luteoviolacea]|uniref:Uncharacterized protein n=1 Tax=Pseudoalteromonas luteoviolacea S4054 TaxID=1129367 RepID=A0A0F6A9U2_9GAMM|nr:hypothetical protein [Pseudoalteromonas luteoviolacea]AOT07423.1 hypothetical protein S4054249_06015 [Pseudoalteromonas luteoviolacea]AOT12339.1 hypothetical protein S40542_06015 [Pseudoalteromonas luteoviolacea]AOT17252.1 hypothetical protein S4054_06015 [Pseudoalteromonas luteoviolacea]KKE82945.1 hypothetical protein N479_01155 [Pseudoalteromonas luteoviolacea S4054]KZN72292.1 hypothetical protein N481_15360 [Pseudoalteromonas luteoviolacea S4047-1]